MNPPAQNKFVVVASQRTGSTLLVRSLDSSPDIFCAGELFHAGSGVYHGEHQFPYRLLGSRALSRLVRLHLNRRRVEEHLRLFYAHAAPRSIAIGFKLMVSQIHSFPTVMPFLMRQGTTLFYLYRNDTFDTAMSYYKAKKSGIYHSDKAGRNRTQVDITADESEFDDLVRTCQSDKDHLLNLHRRLGGHLLVYEDMTAHWDSFVASIGERIGIPGLQIRRTLSKIGGASGSVRVTNEDSLRERFAARGT